jgi:hypothetical protein
MIAHGRSGVSPNIAEGNKLLFGGNSRSAA